MPGLSVTPKALIEGNSIRSLADLESLINEDESSVKLALLDGTIFDHANPTCKFNGRLRMVSIANFRTYYNEWKSLNQAQSET